MEAEANAKKQKEMAFKAALKELEELCQERMPGLKKFDKFWVNGTAARTFKQKEQIEFITKQMSNIKEKDPEKVEARFEKIVDKILEKHQASIKQKAAKEAEEKAKKKAEEDEVDLDGWSKEEIANLTKAIVNLNAKLR